MYPTQRVSMGVRKSGPKLFKNNKETFNDNVILQWILKVLRKINIFIVLKLWFKQGYNKCQTNFYNFH